MSRTRSSAPGAHRGPVAAGPYPNDDQASHQDDAKQDHRERGADKGLGEMGEPIADRRDRGSLGPRLADPPEGKHPGEGDDERWNAHPSHPESLERAHGEARGDRNEKDQRKGQPPVRICLETNKAREIDRATDREIDLAHDHDHPVPAARTEITDDWRKSRAAFLEVRKMPPDSTSNTIASAPKMASVVTRRQPAGVRGRKPIRAVRNAEPASDSTGVDTSLGGSRLVSSGKMEQFVLVGAGATFGYHATLSDHEDSIALGSDLFDIARYHQKAGAFIREILEGPVDLNSGTNVHAKRGLVEDQHPRPRCDARAKKRLLLISTTQGVDGARKAFTNDVQTIDELRVAPVLARRLQ